jgi:hypothetical protein
MKSRNYLEKMEADGSITLKWICKLQVVWMWIYLVHNTIPMVKYCEHDDGHFGFRKGEKFLD